MLRVERLRRISGWLAILSAAVGVIALVGWIRGTDPFEVLRLNAAPMKPGAAVCLILLSGSLWLQLQSNVIARRAGVIAAITALVYVVLTLVQKWFDFGIGVDFFFARNGDASGTRMSSHSGLTLAGIALAHVFLGQQHGRRTWPISAWLSNLAIGISAAALIAGEVATSDASTRPLRLSSHLSFALIMLAAGTLLARPWDRHVQVLFARTILGLFARRLFLGVAVAPLLFNILLASLVRREFVTLADGVLLFVVAMIVSGFSVALFSIEAAAEINQRGEDAEKARQALTSQLQEQAAKLQDTVEERTRELRLANERQREATQKLELLNERLQLALNASQLGVWEFDLVGNRRTWDARVHEMFGLAEGEFDGSRAMCLARVHPDDRGPAEEHLRRVLEGDVRDYAHTFRIIRPDGSVRHIDSRAYLQRDARGNPLRLVGLSRDITEDRRMAEALELAEQRWQLALEATNDSVWDWEIVSGRVFHDERWARMLGYQPGELEDTFAAWKELVHPEDIASDESAARSHFEQRTPYYKQELRVRAKDGTWRWILKRGKVVRRAADGQPLRMAGTHTDVTPRKHLEQRVRKSELLAAEVSRLAQIGGWEIDLITPRVTWTEGARRIHEVADSYQPTMETAWQFFPNDARGTVQTAINALTPSSPAFDVQVPLLTARGGRRWVRMLGRAEFLHGRAVTLHGAVQDLTAQHESCEARRELEAQLFQAQKMETLGTFAGGIAHDFNNLLTGILGYHELAADTLPEDHPARTCLVEARNASLRARDLVEQILTFGRPASSEHGPIDLPHVIEEARRFLQTTLPANIKIEVDCAANCGPVLADATQLYQVILNLASNAAHAMSDSNGVLRIALAPADSSENIAVSSSGPDATRYVRLSISDTGHGMDKATRHRIFDPFFTTKKTSGGTGLGLAVVHGIVRSHRGTIDVESEPGRGSTFHIRLPAAAEERKPVADSNGTAPRGIGEFICVVDDEEVVGTCTKLVLESKGYRSVIFKSAELCLAELQANPSGCALLVTDQTMPGMQGTELATTLRQIAPKLPVVIMSGYFSKIPPQALDELGQVELLGKPFTTDELMAAVQRALHPVGAA